MKNIFQRERKREYHIILLTPTNLYNMYIPPIQIHMRQLQLKKRKKRKEKKKKTKHKTWGARKILCKDN